MSAMFLLLLLPLGLIASMLMGIAGNQDGPDEQAAAGAVGAKVGLDAATGATPGGEAASDFDDMLDIDAMSDEALDAFIFGKGWRNAAPEPDSGDEAGGGAVTAGLAGSTRTRSTPARSGWFARPDAGGCQTPAFLASSK